MNIFSLITGMGLIMGLFYCTWADEPPPLLPAIAIDIPEG
jgi:hypothetical protein